MFNFRVGAKAASLYTKMMRHRVHIPGLNKHETAQIFEPFLFNFLSFVLQGRDKFYAGR
jgi:hypothetical protein